MIMSFSMLPILLFIQMVVLFRTFSKIERDGKISSEQKGQLNMILWAMIFWGAFSAYLGMNGYFTKESFLSSLPGLVMKGFRGEFSLFFAKAVAIPDFLYGVLTLITAVLIYRGVWKEKSAIIVNLIGFVILVPGAMVLMNFSLPGSLNMIQESPNLSAIFEFPMSMAPTIVVPIFAIINLFTIVRLTQRALLKNKKSTKEQIAVPI
jgi:hypothetical protein